MSFEHGASTNELVLGFVPSAHRRSGFLGLKVENFTVMLTTHRLVIIPLSADEMKQAVSELLRQAKQEGKGFLEQWNAQLNAINLILERFAATPVGTILATRPGSFAIPINHIRWIKVDTHPHQQHKRMPNQLIIETDSGRYTYDIPFLRA
ncbi:MAG: hypothetical protein RMJ48_08705 [Roseiflexaceae bacterium]|nr:hypothetical protein [Roseiflexaceae bacterium]